MKAIVVTDREYTAVLAALAMLADEETIEGGVELTREELLHLHQKLSEAK